MHWEAGYESPWAVLTDLEPEEAEVSWYGMRTWIETGFKDFKLLPGMVSPMGPLMYSPYISQ
jgi:hypothetical protein